MRIVLAHGASGTAASMRPHVDGLRARGTDALAIDLPVRKAEMAPDTVVRVVPIGGSLSLDGDLSVR